MKRLSARVALLAALFLALSQLMHPATSTAAGNTIAIDAGAGQGFIQPSVVGQMMEWAGPEMNQAWAEKADDRSFESESVLARRSNLYDAFTGTGLDRSRWTPMSLDSALAGTISVANSQVSIAAAQPGRFGIMSNNVLGSRYAGYTIETRLVSYTGMNVLLNLYGGSGAGDFSKFVEFGVEGGVLKVFADGQPTWTGGNATLPATLRVEVTSLSNTARDFKFYYNSALVYTLNGFTLLPDPFRVFLYGWSGTVTYEYVAIDPDNTYDNFAGTSLTPRWTPTRLAGATNGTISVGSGVLTVNGGASSRYGVLSDYIRNSAIDVSRIDVRLNSQSGTNALINLYGGSGAGDFSKFVEFGIEGGLAHVYTASAQGNWTGGAVSLPATLSVQVGSYFSNGRRIKFYVNGTQVYEFESTDLSPADFRLFLYGYGTSTTQWDYVNISQRHMWDIYAPHFEGGPGLSVEWTPMSLAGGWGSASQGNSQLTINGAANSRYGIISPSLEESDIYGYTVEAKLDNVSGTNGLLDIYAGTGRGDFTKFLEFGIEAGTLRVFGDGIASWTGPAASTPGLLRIEVGPWNGSGRNIYFFYNDQLMYWLENTAVIPNQDYQAFIYGYGTSVTKWDYLTWWKQQPSWSEDGYADRADYTLDRGGYNGAYAEKIEISQHTIGRKGISQGNISVTAGRQYQVSAYLKQSGLAAPVTFAIGPNTGDGPSYSAYASATISGVGTGWAKYTATLTPNTTDLKAKLFIGTGGVGTLWVDMASVMPLDPAEVAYGGWRKDFIDRVQALKPVIVRWPGGIIADWYHWQDGVGSRDQRPPQFFSQWNAQWMTNDIGTHEILDLAANLGLNVALNVNWGAGTSAEAANWVEYTNGAASTTYGAQRAANGHTQPWNVKYWGIGNEVWGWWTPGHTNATTFANSYNVFRDAMIAKDGALEFVGEGGDGTTADQSWNQTMIQTSGTRLDHLGVHYYSPQVLPQNYNSADVYSASVGAPAVIADRMNSSVDTILSNGNQDVKLAVTEYNGMYFNEEHRRTRTLEAGLQMGGLINLFARRADAVEINFASALVNFWDGSAIRLGNRGSFITPAYEVLRLFGAYHGPLLVDASVSSTTFNAPAIGNLPAKSGIPYLDATATRSLDGSKLYVSVVNRDPINALATTITIVNGGAIGSSATAYTLNAGSYLDQNSWQNPNAVATTTATITGVGSSFSYTFPAHSYTVLAINTGAGAVSTPGVIGRVTTSAGAPIAGATVQVQGGNSAVTNTNGYYLIPVASAGTYTLTASKSGYQAMTRSNVEVLSGGGTALPIRLIP